VSILCGTKKATTEGQHRSKQQAVARPVVVRVTSNEVFSCVPMMLISSVFSFSSIFVSMKSIQALQPRESEKLCHALLFLPTTLPTHSKNAGTRDNKLLRLYLLILFRVITMSLCLETIHYFVAWPHSSETVDQEAASRPESLGE
jgi:hypothetical protein